MTNKKFKLFVNIIFILALFIPVITIMLSPRIFVFFDNIRQTHTTSNADIEALKRETPFWRTAIQIYNTSLYHFGISGNKNVFVIGRDGWVFLGDLHIGNFSQGIHRKLISENEAKAWVEILKYQTAFAKKEGIPLLFVLAPAKWDIYSDKLPQWAHKSLQKPSNFDMILKSAENQPVDIIDLRAALRLARKNANTYSPFNTHWNDYGAWVAWTQIAKHIQEKFPKIELFGLEPASPILEKNYGNEYQAMVNLKTKNSWTFVKLRKPFPDYEIISPEGNHTKVKGSTFTDLLDLPRHTVNPLATSPLKILVLRDSMGNALSPYLQSSFRETFQEGHNIRITNAAFNLPADIHRYKPNLIIYIMTERNLLIPLSDINYWKAYHQFEKASLKGEHSWLPHHARSDIHLSRQSFLQKPMNVNLPDLEKNAQVVKLVIEGTGEGEITIRYADNTYPQLFGQGMNEYYFILARNLKNNTFQVTQNSQKASARLVSITTRRY